MSYAPPLSQEPATAAWPWLPHILHAVAESAGLDVALQLAEKFGGERIHLPKLPKDSHPIAQTFGVAILELLIAINGAGRCLIPLGPTSNTATRQRLMQNLCRQGHCNNEIARLLSVHERTVRACRARLRAEMKRLK